MGMAVDSPIPQEILDRIVERVNMSDARLIVLEE
jgi:hypothetical protein